MATKLRRCLYIGLGGTGMNALLHTKKMFIETYNGKVPPMIGFLGIDTDGGAYKKTLDSKYGAVSLSPYEQRSIACRDAKAIYNLHKDEHFTWMPEENEGAIVAMEIGAGQVRTNGRLATIINSSHVETSILQALNNIQKSTHSDNREYELLSNNVEIHMVFSICGGTGCGAFIDLAYLIRRVAPQCKLTGYAVMADVFESMVPSGPAMAKVKPNAYGAVMDLDWLMHLRPSSPPIKFDYITHTMQVSERPFNAVMFIDNKNENNDVYTHADQLTEMISLALVIAAGQLSVAAASVSDNIEKYYADGSMDIADKKAWAAGMGACEIVFRGKDLSEIYAIKSAQRIIQRLMNGCNDVDTIINNWIDSPEVNIRENNGRDDVIDFILKKEPKIPMVSINDPLNAKPETDMYIASAMPKDDAVKGKIQELSERIKKEFISLLIKQINQECGLSNAEDIILGLQKQLHVFLKEMKEELETFENTKASKQQAIEIAVDNLSQLERKMFVIGKSGKRESLIEDVIAATMLYTISEREIIRRRAAITFYTGLQATLMDEYTRVGNIKRLLLTVNTDLTTRLAEVHNLVGKKSQTFMIDLVGEAAKNVYVEDNELNIPEFVRKLNLPNSLYDLDGKDVADVKAALFSYTENLTIAKKWEKTTIDDIIDKMPEDEFEHLMRMAINKAMPLFRKDYQGHIPGTQLYEGYFVGVPDKGNSRFTRNDAFKNKQQGATSIDFISLGMDDHIIIYRQIGVIPAYAIASLKTYEEKYNNCRTVCHFDKNVLIRMNREEYSLMPKQQDDDTLELWIYGLIFGLIKNEDNSYYYKSQLNGDPLFDNWVKMGIQYRDEAFEYFKHNKSSIRREFNEQIEDEQRSKGLDAMQELKADVKANYLEKYSQINMSREELTKRGNENIADLIRKELMFVQKNL
ncbi:tubulin-like doman-containing protein [Bacteroides sp. 519]|uniref:tubulin-like doman-containing protein n=1 Tax=Bacteroides sp. 519 TaxID=2302937 RepID=UPI0013D3DEFE|nr:tubulin-like doman-containing protein [Bacteroides sp. 519]NDV58124.1 hypothetical protein [Bacteroides sp. 519]